MAQFFPFQALRPSKEAVEVVSCLPYDVLSEAECRKLAAEPDSFIHVIRSEADLEPGTDPYGTEVYAQAAASLNSMKDRGVLKADEKPCYYLYREITPDHTQTGIVGTVSSEEYEAGIIRRHELTVAEKEDDRTRHILACRAQTGPVFLTFPEDEIIAEVIARVSASEPSIDFETNEVRHQVWVIDQEDEQEVLREAFAKIPVLYIADGHHRAASSLRAAKQLNTSDQEEAGRFMAVAFPAGDLCLLGYHRYVCDLNGKSESEVLEEIKRNFDVECCGDTRIPEAIHEIVMLLNGTRYLLRPHCSLYQPDDSIGRLDVSILQKFLLEPVLGIHDPRRDHRITFVGGMHGEEEIKVRCETTDSIGFLLYPTDIHDLIAVADDHGIMPPKSTWFEPKLLSGLFVHEI